MLYKRLAPWGLLRQHDRGGYAADETIMAIAGHVSRAMLTHYGHIRTEAKRRALEAISTRPAPAEGAASQKVAS